MMNDALRLVRVFHDLTQSETARRTGLSKSYVSELEAGNRKASIDVLEKYAIAFKIPVSSLMLFSEHCSKGDFSKDIRSYIANKVIKMLDWVATISEDTGANEGIDNDR
jgi:transcriptional regulator with XRE-family HTH domain